MKCKKVIVCIIMILLVLSACSTKTFDNALEQGLASLEEKDYSKAVSYFEIALDEDSDSEEATSYLEQATLLNDASNSIKEEDYEQALNSIIKLEKLDNLLSVVKTNAKELKEQITLEQESLVYEDELESIRTLIDKEEYDTAETKLETLKNVLGNNSNFQVQLEEISTLLTEKRIETESQSKESQQESEEESDTEEQPRSEQKKTTFTYNTYTNTRYGFSVQYPTTFTEGPAPANNDGRKFHYENCTITASGSHINIIQDNETIETYYNEALQDASGSGSTTYQRLGSDWYVVSYNDDGNTVYEKAIMGEDIISRLIITYPTNQQKDYQSMVEQVSSTFKGGQAELY
ncbi:outer membrane protein assembly factor BamD [Niallia endozanthoxylica]|uniref:Uncharacterized protein n=1 Tax=Niallia endozanthoxylica TaxID=2036016 RepID=A0A5J5GTK2_9BACI|nr:hypothetical protein [Niallia endozanthoxylica]KAA9011779.1 hypothetical protein F4V44_26485 [Niallia endozanthoxylica]